MCQSCVPAEQGCMAAANHACTEAPCLLLLRSFLTSISFVPNPNLYPEPPVQGYAAAALGAVALSQVRCSASSVSAAGQLGATCNCFCHTAEPVTRLPVDPVCAQSIQQEH